MKINRFLFFWLIFVLALVLLLSGCQNSSEEIRPLPEDCLKNAKIKTNVAYIPLVINKYGLKINIGDPEASENIQLVVDTLEKFQNDNNLQILSWSMYLYRDSNSKTQLRGLCITFFKAKETTESKNETQIENN